MASAFETRPSSSVPRIRRVRIVHVGISSVEVSCLPEIVVHGLQESIAFLVEKENWTIIT